MDQARELELPQMLGDRRLGHPGGLGQRADRRLALPAKTLENRPAGRIGEGSEQEVGVGHGLDI